jgi:HK97 gp10 family phage protein
MPIQGLDEVLRNLNALPELLQKKALTRVARAGGRVVLLRARSKIHSISGRLARSGRVSVLRRGDQMIARVKFGRNVKKDDPYYAVMLEKGTKPHEIRPAGAASLFLAGLFREVVQHPGAQPRPFLGPSLEEAQDDVLAAMQKELVDQVDELTP